MEHQHQHEIKLETSTAYHLPLEELKKMYTLMALAKYNYLRHPNYNEDRLLKLFQSDIKKLLAETQTLMEEMPNNHNLHKILSFFDNHCKNLKRITEPKA